MAPAPSFPSPPPTVRVQLEGSRVSLILPNGFSRLAFTTMLAESGRSTVVSLSETDLLGLDGQQATRLASGYLPKIQGNQTTFDRAGSKGIQLIGEKQAALVIYDGHGRNSLVLVTGQTKIDPTMVETLFKSVLVDFSRPLDPLALHQISFANPAGFVVLPMAGSGVTFGEQRSEIPKDAREVTTLTVTYSPTTQPSNESVMWFLAGALRGKQFKQQYEKAFEVDGLAGLERLGTGNTERSEVFVYCACVGSAATGTFCFFGSGELVRAAVLLPRMKQLVRSFRRDANP